LKSFPAYNRYDSKVFDSQIAEKNRNTQSNRETGSNQKPFDQQICGTGRPQLTIKACQDLDTRKAMTIHAIPETHHRWKAQDYKQKMETGRKND
jgi:hypothetical protein